MATQENPAQERAWVFKENEHSRRPGCHKIETVKGTQEISSSIVGGFSACQLVKKGQRLTKPEQFKVVYTQGNTRVDRFLVLKAMPNQLDCYRYGISVSKKIGKAVVRNRLKRVLREIIRLTPLETGWDLVIIVRSPAASVDYRQIKESLVGLLSRAKILAR
jgi:ribonuclease P protein component